MTTKKYIGSGKSTKFNGVTVTIRMEDAQQFAYETEHGTFLSFVVSPRKEADKYGKTHSAFVLLEAEDGTPAVPEMAAEVVAEPAPEAPKKKGKKAKA